MVHKGRDKGIWGNSTGWNANLNDSLGPFELLRATQAKRQIPMEPFKILPTRGVWKKSHDNTNRNKSLRIQNWVKRFIPIVTAHHFSQLKCQWINQLYCWCNSKAQKNLSHITQFAFWWVTFYHHSRCFHQQWWWSRDPFLPAFWINK